MRLLRVLCAQCAVHKGLRYPCTKCDKEFTENNHLRDHIRSVHLGLNYECEHCGKKITTRNYLTKHIKKVHGTPKKF